MKILDADIHLIDLEARLPFRYGIVTMTRCPHCFFRLRIETDNGSFQGIAADHLPPKWFTKVPDKPIDEEIDEMLRVIEHAGVAAVGLAGQTAYDLYREFRQAQSGWGEEEGIPPLLSQFGTSMVERALVEATCRARGERFSDILRADAFGLRLEDFDPRLEGYSAADLLPPPITSINARHTVGMVDPLTEAEVSPEERVDDGLPQSLDACIRAYDLSHFKLKIGSDFDVDRDRLGRISSVVAGGHRSFAFSLDGNECFESMQQFRDWWSEVAEQGQLQSFMRHLLFVEQPFHRDVALDPDAVGDLRDWSARPPLIIDESDAEPDSLARALELGYQGTSHKNCKGVFKSIANTCLLERLRRGGATDRLLISGEDLCNIGPLALLQDLAVAAALGIDSVERNGHHYFAGLSGFPPAIGANVLQSHPDLYRATEGGWPTLSIRNGRIAAGSVSDACFGAGFELDLEYFSDVTQWRSTRADSEGANR